MNSVRDVLLTVFCSRYAFVVLMKAPRGTQSQFSFFLLRLQVALFKLRYILTAAECPQICAQTSTETPTVLYEQCTD